MRTLTRRYLLAGSAATLVLAGSTVALAAATHAFTSRSCTPPHVAGTVVQVTAIDMGHMPTGMMGGQSDTMRLLARPATAPAGTVSLLVHNAGSRTHEVVVLPLPAGTPAGARTPARTDGSTRPAASVRHHAPAAAEPATASRLALPAGSP